MAFWGDYHTHTVHSHGKGTIEENVAAAIEKGLKEIAITDHGFRHMVYQVHRKEFPSMRKTVDELNAKYPGINIYLGIESNLTSFGGKADLRPDDIEKLDLVICGYHKLVFSDKISDMGFFVRNLLGGESKSSVRRMVKNTDAYLKLLEKYEIDIISHINYGISADAVEVAKACKHFGTFVELNGKRINITDAEIEKMLENGVEFICNSDAHSVDRIADFSVPLAVINRVGVPMESIANWERLPQFRSRKSK